MKIAVMGSASSSVGKAPFKNAEYDRFVQGRIESIERAHGQVSGDWDIWGCSPGCWAVIPRATRWFEVHRWEPQQEWFSPQYRQFLNEFKGIVYTGGVVHDIPNHVIYPIDEMEEKFSAYFMTSSLALMMALAIDTIEKIRIARGLLLAGRPREQAIAALPQAVSEDELGKPDSDDVIGLWGVDMAANDEYAYQRPGCQFFVIEAQRRGIGAFLPPESDLMRPMPVYGISEWDHNYIKLTSRARELNVIAQQAQQMLENGREKLAGIHGEQHALQYFVQTWTNPYGMQAGMIVRQAEGTGLGGGITSFDGRPIERMHIQPKPQDPVLAIGDPQDVQLGREVVAKLEAQAQARHANVRPQDMLEVLVKEAAVARAHSSLLQDQARPGEGTADTLARVIAERDAARDRLRLEPNRAGTKGKRRR